MANEFSKLGVEMEPSAVYPESHRGLFLCRSVRANPSTKTHFVVTNTSCQIPPHLLGYAWLA